MTQSEREALRLVIEAVAKLVECISRGATPNLEHQRAERLAARGAELLVLQDGLQDVG